MFLTYNGIQLKIEHVNWDQRPVYDPSGVTFLYAHHRITVRAIWNPAATADGTKVAAESIANLRATLMTPRKRLTMDVPASGGTPKRMLTSPQQSGDDPPVIYDCDCNNGPKPVGEPIIQLIGQKTAIVDFTIETWVNDCTNMRPILSHHWEMSHDIDQDFYTTRTITGTAIFRTDWLAFRVANPDDFRSWLFHPVPDNFQRKRISVQTSSDNTTLRYTIVDQEQPANIAAQYRQISRIEGTYSLFIGQAGFTPGRAVQAAVAGGPVGFVTNLVEFPTMRIAANIRVWGRRSATTVDLDNALASAMTTLRFNGQTLFGDPVLSVFFNSLNLNYDLFNRYVEATCVCQVGVGGILAQVLLQKGPLVAALNQNAQTATAAPVTSTADGPTSNPTDGAYGTWLRAVVAQSLSQSCANPPGIDQTVAYPDAGSLRKKIPG